MSYLTEIGALAGALKRGDCKAADDHLNQFVREMDTERRSRGWGVEVSPAALRESIERGRFSVAAKPVVATMTFEGSPIVDGVLKDASIYAYDAAGSKVAAGAIYGDRKGRFADGVRITTSTIISGPDAAGIIHTRNSVYRVELAA